MRLLTALRKSDTQAAYLKINLGRWVYVVQWEREYVGKWYTTEIHQFNKKMLSLSIISYTPVNRHQLKIRLGDYDISEDWEPLNDK